MQETKIPDLNDVSKAAEAMSEQLRKSLAGNLGPLVTLLDQLLTQHEAFARTYLGLVGDARQALQYFGSTGSVAADGPAVKKMTVQ
jgi:hypothetical protein